MTQPLIELKQITKWYDAKPNNHHIVLTDINLVVQEGEFVAILGPSGSGKSTLLRIIAGLTAANQGTVSYLGHVVSGINPGVSMVFQSFALFPWLTVLENVLVGLENKKIARSEKKAKALQIIDMLGLDGFESAYPKELSGGMRQRVGLGRALVSDPDVLLMDEPFSALDVLTADNLRRDILGLWLNHNIQTKSIIMITHGIEEAVYMADRIVILANGPAKIIKEIRIDIPRWRDKKQPEFLAVVDQIYSLMVKQIGKIRTGQLRDNRHLVLLPDVSMGALTGFLELLNEFNQTTDLYKLAEKLMMDIAEFFPIVDVVALLGFAQIQNGDIVLTGAGRQFATGSVLERKNLFRKQVLRYVPMIQQIVCFLESTSNKKIHIGYFTELLTGYFTAEQVIGQLEIVIRWGRYAEVFAYNDQSCQFYLEQEESV